MTFSSLGLSTPICRAVTNQGYNSPTPIQTKAIPAVLAGRDVMAAAQTGTGKTASFTLPLLERLSKTGRPRSNHMKALILTPTRELAAQIQENIQAYSEFLSVKSTVVFGGVKINPQMMALRGGVDFLVATPGRLLDLYHQNAVKFNQLDVLVLDEADRMLDMGFIRDIKKIIALLPKRRQNLLFSATFSDSIRKLASDLVYRPVEIAVSPKVTTAQTVKQWICPTDKKKKPALLAKLIQEKSWEQVLVFTKTKHGANRLTAFLEKCGIKAAAIHGNKSQGARTRALAEFKRGELNVLVATDIAARGIDIEQLPQVVNFELPNKAEDYVHRIGRTGRAGCEGQAVSFVSLDEFDLLNDIERLIKQLLERVELKGFEPSVPLPHSHLNRRVEKTKHHPRPSKNAPRNKTYAKPKNTTKPRPVRTVKKQAS